MADKLYLNGGMRALRGLELLDVEWSNIDGSFNWCKDHAQTNRTIDLLSCEFPFAGACLRMDLISVVWVGVPELGKAVVWAGDQR